MKTGKTTFSKIKNTLTSTKSIGTETKNLLDAFQDCFAIRVSVTLHKPEEASYSNGEQSLVNLGIPNVSCHVINCNVRKVNSVIGKTI